MARGTSDQGFDLPGTIAKHKRRRLQPHGARSAPYGSAEAPGGFEPPNRGFADLRLTTWPRRRGEETNQAGTLNATPENRVPKRLTYSRCITALLEFLIP